MPVSGLEIPFEARLSPFLDRAHDHGLRWARETGMVKSDKAVAYWTAIQMDGFACRYWPQAPEQNIDLAVDVMTFYFFFDDQFDGELGYNPDKALDVLGHLAEITLTDGRTDQRNPLFVAFADIWSRAIQNMSPTWRYRAAHHWRDYFYGHFFEAVGRKGNLVHDLASYKQGRLSSAGPKTSIDLIERIGGYEVPEHVLLYPQLWLMREIIAETTWMSNDLQSYEKELNAKNDSDNLVFVVSRTSGIPIPEAADRVRAEAHRRLQEFARLEDELPRIIQALGAETYGKVIELYVEGLKLSLAGQDAWGNTTFRYQRDDLRPTAVLGYLEDLTGATNPSVVRG